jgi:hypothetical protein
MLLTRAREAKEYLTFHGAAPITRSEQRRGRRSDS